MDRNGAGTPPHHRVLLVEDNRGLRRSLSYLLKDRGYYVEEAEDGRMGLGKALEWLPEAAVVDIDLPGLDGYGLAQRIRQALGNRTGLVALTAQCADGDREKALAAGFDQYLAKPAEFETLDAVIKELVAAAKPEHA